MIMSHYWDHSLVCFSITTLVTILKAFLSLVEGNRIRTDNRQVKSLELYQLSYTPRHLNSGEYYTTCLNNVTSFLRLTDRLMGPLIYLDITLTFLLILIPELSLKLTTLISLNLAFTRVRTSQHLHISPLILYLYLNPLYSILGGSTTLAEPLIKRPSWELPLNDPLYRWKIFSHLTLVLSVINNQVCFCNNKTLLKKGIINNQ